MTSLRAVANESIPYFSQFTTRHPSSNETDSLTKDSASRHVYAAGLEQIPSVAECNEQRSSYSDHSDCSEAVEEDEPSSLNIRLPKPPPKITTLEDSDVVGLQIRKYVVNLWCLGCFFFYSIFLID